jgi:hypothetical protein
MNVLLAKMTLAAAIRHFAQCGYMARVVENFPQNTARRDNPLAWASAKHLG